MLCPSKSAHLTASAEAKSCPCRHRQPQRFAIKRHNLHIPLGDRQLRQDQIIPSTAQPIGQFPWRRILNDRLHTRMTSLQVPQDPGL